MYQQVVEVIHTQIASLEADLEELSRQRKAKRIEITKLKKALRTVTGEGTRRNRKGDPAQLEIPAAAPEPVAEPAEAVASTSGSAPAETASRFRLGRRS